MIPLIFGKIINIFLILQDVCKRLNATVLQYIQNPCQANLDEPPSYTADMMMTVSCHYITQSPFKYYIIETQRQ